MYCTTEDIHALGTILGIWAHPDDESFCMAGIMAVARSNGQRVACVTATKGDAGRTADESRWPQSRLGEIRQEELKKAMDILGVHEHYWLDYTDGRLATSDGAKAIQQLTAIIKDVKPDTIFTFGPDGITGHEDHKTICRWACQAAKISGVKPRIYLATEVKEKYDAIPEEAHNAFNIYFNVDVPQTVPAAKVDFFFQLPEQILNKKIESLRAQECQTSGMFASRIGKNLIYDIAASEAFMEAGQ